MSDRRRFLAWLGAAAMTVGGSPRPTRAAGAVDGGKPRSDASLTLFLCGDVMTGRGIDQILPHPNSPELYEPYLRDARDYVALAERANGRFAHPVPYDYIWGDALTELTRVAPDVCIVNLETAVTAHDGRWPKGINYRMHPDNIDVLAAAGIDCCVLANNHLLDWGRQGLDDTLVALSGAGIRTAGAGRTLSEAQAPAVLPVPEGRVLVFAFAERYSGVDSGWRATATRPGIDLLDDLSPATLQRIAGRVRDVKQAGDIAVASIHWGGNWGYGIPDAQRRFAWGLIDRAGIDLVHGHSSHHVKGIEVHDGHLILYGCGDFLNDYEGIRGHEAYRGELGLMYFPTLDPVTGRLLALMLSPTRIRHMRVQRATAEESAWLAGVLDREGRALGSGVMADGQGRLNLVWDAA